MCFIHKYKRWPVMRITTRTWRSRLCVRVERKRHRWVVWVSAVIVVWCRVWSVESGPCCMLNSNRMMARCWDVEMLWGCDAERLLGYELSSADGTARHGTFTSHHDAYSITSTSPAMDHVHVHDHVILRVASILRARVDTTFHSNQLGNTWSTRSSRNSLMNFQFLLS